MRQFSLVPVLARSIHRGHITELTHTMVGYQIREICKPSLKFSKRALAALSDEPETANKWMAHIRRRDAAHFEIETVDDIYARNLIFTRIKRDAGVLCASGV